MEICTPDYILQIVAFTVRLLMTIGATAALAYKLHQALRTPTRVTLNDVVSATLAGATIPLSLLYIASAFDRCLIPIAADLNVYLVVVGGILLFQSLRGLSSRRSKN